MKSITFWLNRAAKEHNIQIANFHVSSSGSHESNSLHKTIYSDIEWYSHGYTYVVRQHLFHQNEEALNAYIQDIKNISKNKMSGIENIKIVDTLKGL